MLSLRMWMLEPIHLGSRSPDLCQSSERWTPSGERDSPKWVLTQDRAREDEGGGQGWEGRGGNFWQCAHEARLCVVFICSSLKFILTAHSTLNLCVYSQ